MLSTHFFSNAAMMRCLPFLWILSARTSPRDTVHKAGVLFPNLHSAVMNQCLSRFLLKGSCKVFAPSGTTSGARVRSSKVGHRLARGFAQVRYPAAAVGAAQMLAQLYCRAVCSDAL